MARWPVWAPPNRGPKPFTGCRKKRWAGAAPATAKRSSLAASLRRGVLFRATELFEPMVSWRGSRKTAPGSVASSGEQPHLGLGLFIARLIAERHGGQMRAEATAAGSRFGLALRHARRDDIGPL